MSCDHSGPHSGALRRLRGHDLLRLVIVCDQCGAERAEIGRIDYRPDRRSADDEIPVLKPSAARAAAA